MLRDQRLLPGPLEVVDRTRLTDPFLPKIEERVERSHGKIRADKTFGKLQALGFTGSDSTVRRAVARVKSAEDPSESSTADWRSAGKLDSRKVCERVHGHS